jgi:hypothetical protein
VHCIILGSGNTVSTFQEPENSISDFMQNEMERGLLIVREISSSGNIPCGYVPVCLTVHVLDPVSLWYDNAGIES